LSKADVITLYLLPQAQRQADPAAGQAEARLPHCVARLRHGGRAAKREITFTPPGGRDHRIYLWVTPLEKMNNK